MPFKLQYLFFTAQGGASEAAEVWVSGQSARALWTPTGWLALGIDMSFHGTNLPYEPLYEGASRQESPMSAGLSLQGTFAGRD